MPIQLTTPFNMGDVDTNYTHAKIQEFKHSARDGRIEMVVNHGTLNGSTFVPGKFVFDATEKQFVIEGSEYLAMVTKLTSAQGVYIYNEVARELYQWLIDKGHYVGTIV